MISRASSNNEFKAQIYTLTRAFPAYTYNLKKNRSLVPLDIFNMDVVLLLYVPVNSYGHGGTVSSPYHTFFSGHKLEQAVNQYFVHILSLAYGNNPS